MVALSGVLFLCTVIACGQTSSSNSDPAGVSSSSDRLADDLYFKPLAEEWRTKPGSSAKRIRSKHPFQPITGGPIHSSETNHVASTSMTSPCSG